MTEQFHSLYCPKCAKTVRIPYATEIAERRCPTPECGAEAHELYPSKAMYERLKPAPTAAVAASEASPAEEPTPLNRFRRKPR